MNGLALLLPQKGHCKITLGWDYYPQPQIWLHLYPHSKLNFGIEQYHTKLPQQ